MKRIIIILMFPTIVFSQTIDCSKNYNWLKKTFEENDAGFQYAINQKNKNAYENHNQLFRKKVKDIKTLPECGKQLMQWLNFFRSGHLVIRLVNQHQVNSPTQRKTNYQPI